MRVIGQRPYRRRRMGDEPGRRFASVLLTTFWLLMFVGFVAAFPVYVAMLARVP